MHRKLEEPPVVSTRTHVEHNQRNPVRSGQITLCLESLDQVASKMRSDEVRDLSLAAHDALPPSSS